MVHKVAAGTGIAPISDALQASAHLSMPSSGKVINPNSRARTCTSILTLPDYRFAQQGSIPLLVATVLFRPRLSVCQLRHIAD
jgi:hypothetical protein